MTLRYGYDLVFDFDCDPFCVKKLSCRIKCDEIVVHKFDIYTVGNRARILYPCGPIDIQHVRWTKMLISIYQEDGTIANIKECRVLTGEEGSKDIICGPWSNRGETYYQSKDRP